MHLFLTFLLLIILVILVNNLRLYFSYNLLWKSKKLDNVSKSSTLAEYHVMSTTCGETVWLHRLSTNFGIHFAF